jgi:hypothetical protein
LYQISFLRASSSREHLEYSTGQTIFRTCRKHGVLSQHAPSYDYASSLTRQKLCCTEHRNDFSRVYELLDATAGCRLGQKFCRTQDTYTTVRLCAPSNALSELSFDERTWSIDDRRTASHQCEFSCVLTNWQPRTMISGTADSCRVSLLCALFHGSEGVENSRRISGKNHRHDASFLFLLPCNRNHIFYRSSGYYD